MTDLARPNGPDAVSYLGVAAGLAAFGALAIGAIAIGSLAIGRLSVKRLRVQSLEVGTLTVHRFNVLEGPRPNIQTASAADHPSSSRSETRPEQNSEARPAPRRRRPRKPSPA
jgi:hypothetical protein